MGLGGALSSGVSGIRAHQNMLEVIGNILDRGKEQSEFSFSPTQGSLLSLLRQRGRILDEKFDGDTIRVTALLSPKLAGQIRKRLGEVC
ncbi:MAG: hypothetical protein A2Z58_07880 [Planctomycetes bacterium RIFCSPHIGHO2_12_42_15]|nr:MAG: hypothetical protein A2Z58_07880 [Planctomycetes bacterium RIFCSPHIGHO2_12_42_15]